MLVIERHASCEYACTRSTLSLATSMGAISSMEASEYNSGQWPQASAEFATSRRVWRRRLFSHRRPGLNYGLLHKRKGPLAAALIIPLITTQCPHGHPPIGRLP